jgi:hypothetical protein
MVAIGAGLVAYTQPVNKTDGAVAVVVGLGDPALIGFDAAVVVLDLHPDAAGHGGFGQRGTFFFKLHRKLPGDFSAAVGIENAFDWGDPHTPGNVYGVVTKSIAVTARCHLPVRRLQISGGVGNGRFAWSRNQSENEWGAFASAAGILSPQARIFAEWVGGRAGIGVSIVPLRALSLTLTPAITDLANRSRRGPWVSVSAGYSIDLH